MRVVGGLGKSKSAQPRRSGARANATRVRLLEAAERRFAAEGYAAARLEDIAGDIGIRGAAIFYYYRDKRQLYEVVLRGAIEAQLSCVRQALEGPGSLAERMEAGLVAVIDFAVARPTVPRLILREAAGSAPEAEAILREINEPVVQLLTDLFEEGRRSGELRPLVPDIFQFLSIMGGATLFYVAAVPSLHQVSLPYDPLSPEAVAAHKQTVVQVLRLLLGIGQG